MRSLVPDRSGFGSPKSAWIPEWDFLRQYELRGELITVDPGARLTINPEAIPLVVD